MSLFAIFATALTPFSSPRAVVTNLPSPEMKKAVCVRSNLPEESNTVIQNTAGRTLFSNRAKSSVGRCVVCDCGVRLNEVDGPEDWAGANTPGDEEGWAAGDSPGI